jgi:hypothetical protein
MGVDQTGQHGLSLQIHHARGRLPETHDLPQRANRYDAIPCNGQRFRARARRVKRMDIAAHVDCVR